MYTFIPLYRYHAARPAIGLYYDTEGGTGPESRFSKAQVDAAVETALRRERALTKAILSAAKPHQPVDAAAVVLLAGEQLAFDQDGRLVVRGKRGATRYGIDGNHLSVEGYMAEFAKENGYLFKNASGSATKPGENEAKPLSGVQKIALGFSKRKT